MPIAVRWGSATHPGCVRSGNQDAVIAGPVVFAVADGMGGHAAGEVASALAIGELATVGEGGAVDHAAVVRAVGRANRAIRGRGAADGKLEGMGTTVAGVVLLDSGSPAVLAFNVGDSRVYRWRVGDGLSQISDDHSLVAEMVRAGEVNAAAAREHPQRNVVTRALGTDDHVEVDTWALDVAAGDRFLVCSDGLTNEVHDGVLESRLVASEDPEVTVAVLMDLALDAGARDNVSCVVLHVDQVSVGTEPIEEDTNPREGLDDSTEVLAASLIKDVPRATTAPSEPSDGAGGDGGLITDVPSPSAGAEVSG